MDFFCSFFLLLQTLMYESLQGYSIPFLLGKYPRSGSYGRCMFNVLKDCQMIFQRGSTIFSSY